MHQLIFVYNAKLGLVNSVLDIGHKLLSPKTYTCKLCSITHNTFSENKAWTKFRNQSKLDMVFYHLDEFEEAFPDQDFTYPIILLKNIDSLNEFLSTDELNAMKSAEQLISWILNNF